MKNLILKNLTLMMLLLIGSNISFSQSWNLNGNAAGVNNFLGTTNGTNLTIKTSNTTRMTILSSGNLGVGVTTPSAQFHTTGTVRFQGLLQNAGNTNFVVADASGNLAVRDINTITFNNTWNTTGNFSGGFIGTNNNSAFPFRTNNLERMRITETGLIGIGTTTPSAQLHTTSTVRFAGISSFPNAPRLLVSDASGNVSFSEVSTMNSFWKPTGNAAVAGNFMGTSNNIPLPFRTNNIERLRITESGNIGIGTTTPSVQFHTTGGVRFAGLSILNNAQRILVSDASGNISYNEVNTMNTFWKSSGNSISGAEFIGTTNFNPLTFKTNAIERFRVSENGNVGIATTTPTSLLHVNCTAAAGVRFENLPIFPVGTVLIQDVSGNVFNSGIDVTTLVNLVQNKNEEASRIAALEKELQELKALLKKANPTSVTLVPTKATLYQNYPNPTGGFTNIKVVVEENNATIKCNIYDINNTLVQSHAIKGNGEQVLSVDTQSLGSAVYFYTLEIDEKIIDSKKLIIQK